MALFNYIINLIFTDVTIKFQFSSPLGAKISCLVFYSGREVRFLWKWPTGSATLPRLQCRREVLLWTCELFINQPLFIQLRVSSANSLACSELMYFYTLFLPSPVLRISQVALCLCFQFGGIPEAGEEEKGNCISSVTRAHFTAVREQNPEQWCEQSSLQSPWNWEW